LVDKRKRNLVEEWKIPTIESASLLLITDDFQNFHVFEGFDQAYHASLMIKFYRVERRPPYEVGENICSIWT